MSLKVGDNFPSGVFRLKDEEGLKEVSTEDYFKSCKVVLFALPGAFTPTCSAKHLPGFINNYDEIISKGVSKIACMAVNDPHVMRAWGEVSGVNGKIDMLSDSDCSVSKSLGLDHNFGKVLGHRSKRFAIIVDNNVIKGLFVEEIGAFDVSTAENILNNL
ncbi:MAG: peroxiredoxin [Candidatus Puniceispirillales bacterium]|jgi:peroxiredoxin|nr:peroxiredoxin [Alphaproteobacteria bacterium]MBL6850526.1 peroxiredoxin [Alphaproteobacteria bacterium]MDA0916711.1 peroxiredoxin [Pseudomonadota bacterium]